MNGFPRFDVQGKIALVTGAARGLGRAISLALAHSGADVALGLRDVNADADLASEIALIGRRALPLQMDMSRLDQVSSAIEKAADHFGRLDILVNNAGIAPENLAENVTEKDFDATLAVNFNVADLAGFVVPTRLQWLSTPGLRHLSGGFAGFAGEFSVYLGLPLLLVAGVAAWQLRHRPGPRAASLVAVVAMVLSLGGRLHVLGHATRIPLPWLPFAHLPVLENIVPDRLAEVGGAVVILASHAASLITGHTLLIDGGWTAR